jgi:acetate kinase
MTDQSSRRVLTINAGSSSLKSTLYQDEHQDEYHDGHQQDPGRSLSQCLSAEVVRIGSHGCRMRIADASGKTLLDSELAVPDHRAATEALFEWIAGQPAYRQFDAVGHRIVHGGSQYSQPQLVTSDLINALSGMISLDPDHLPQAIAGLQSVSRLYPSLPQVACFDTAFHRQMPKVAQMYALPRKFFDEGIVRYGFHGLSYEFIVKELQALDGELAGGRVVAAHLGNGASMAAIRDGKSIDTTMGFTPTEGLVMGTRSGDIDPGVLIYLALEKKMSPDEIESLINNQSGLLGVSGISEDVRDLLEKEATETGAAEALDLFCYRAKKYIGAYAAVLGGLDILVFAGGIGEHAAPIRGRICHGLETLGIRIDQTRNDANAAIISADESPVKVRVIKTNEDLIIASHTLTIISKTNPS